MTRQELISRLDAERTRLEDVIGGLPPDQMTAPGAVGDWSVKDVLAHLAMWTSRCVTLVFQAEQGQPPEDVGAMFDGFEALNAADYQLQKDRPLDRVLADFRGSHRQLLRRLGSWPEASLDDPKRFPYLRGMSMSEFLISEVADHDAEHRKQIEAWKQARHL